jgi:phosphatidylglycerol:prolipoprotein diacylglycerol transferase
VQGESIQAVIPESGLVSVTARVYGINAGEWSVMGELVAPPERECSRTGTHPSRGRSLRPALWSWRRWALSPESVHALTARWARLTPFDAMPAVVPGSWLGLVTLGVVIGFVFQAWLLPREHLAVDTVLPISLLAILAGAVGGKLWYIALNLRTWRRSPQEGWCIQGALVGATGVGIAAAALVHLPIGGLLDATTPGLFMGVTVGRLGCFFTGCCAGRPTASRFGVWCSDRRIGARRIPTQLMESLAALVIGLVALVVVLRHPLAAGVLFLAAMAAYTLCRQPILRLRAEHRRSATAGPLTAVAAAIVLVGSIVWLLVRGQ